MLGKLQRLDLLEDLVEDDNVDGPCAELGCGETLPNHVLFIVLFSGIVYDLVNSIENGLLDFLTVEGQNSLQELFRLIH